MKITLEIEEVKELLEITMTQKFPDLFPNGAEVSGLGYSDVHITPKEIKKGKED